MTCAANSQIKTPFILIRIGIECSFLTCNRKFQVIFSTSLQLQPWNAGDWLLLAVLLALEESTLLLLFEVREH